LFVVVFLFGFLDASSCVLVIVASFYFRQLCFYVCASGSGVSPHLHLRLPGDLPAPPFSAVARHVPQQGDLLLFPAWLVHSVDSPPTPFPAQPATGRDHAGSAAAAAALKVARADASNVRVSASFNIGDGWEGTAPVHVDTARSRDTWAAGP
jgi:hypothetical protein